MAEITKLPLHQQGGLTTEHLRGAYADAEARGDFGNARILSYRWSKPDRALHCVVRDSVTGKLLLYGLDPTSGKVRCLGAVDH